MGHYSSDYEHEAQKLKCKTRSELEKAVKLHQELRSILRTHAPGWVQDDMDRVDAWLYSQLH